MYPLQRGGLLDFGISRQKVLSSRVGLRHISISDLMDQNLWVDVLVSADTRLIRSPALLRKSQRHLSVMKKMCGDKALGTEWKFSGPGEGSIRRARKDSKPQLGKPYDSSQQEVTAEDVMNLNLAATLRVRIANL